MYYNVENNQENNKNITEHLFFFSLLNRTLHILFIPQYFSEVWMCHIPPLPNMQEDTSSTFAIAWD